MIRERWLTGRKTKHFTLQWHLTNACRFACKHCYDRSDRKTLSLAESLGVLSALREFGRVYRVKTTVCLSGGDPLCYAHFWDLYEIMAKDNMAISILGNPVSAEVIKQLLAIQSPVYYQVSLEGGREHNDDIRGAGHYDQVIEFLAEARRLGMKTQVMLTLTQANMEQIIPLGEVLRGLTSRFTFNRLSRVGQAQDLELPAKPAYRAFLRKYLAQKRHNPVLGFKDNLFNILRQQFRQRFLPGCTGFGCGAAFNFVALLPDGEVYACRKYPSSMGNILKTSLVEIFASEIAQRYRDGAVACHRCQIRNVCGGCPAVSYGQGLDPMKDVDPYCFLAG